MTEGKSTGIPTVQEELRDNGSPKATFETDDESKMNPKMRTQWRMLFCS